MRVKLWREQAEHGEPQRKGEHAAGKENQQPVTQSLSPRRRLH
jgi:hypothetical protein